jgi:hypothetical protein
MATITNTSPIGNPSNPPPLLPGVRGIVTATGHHHALAATATVGGPPRPAAAGSRRNTWPSCGLAARLNPRDFVTEAELRACGLTPSAVRRRCPWATEYIAIDGTACWQLMDLAPLLESGASQ